MGFFPVKLKHRDDDDYDSEGKYLTFNEMMMMMMLEQYNIYAS
jgi:hypothetical protein